MSPGQLYKSIPVATYGRAKIVHDSPDALTRARAARDGQPLREKIYTRLFVDGVLWMTDSEFECYTNYPFLRRAFGDVLIAGLGLGLILRPLIESNEVTSITVIEQSADVIELIRPHYDCKKLSVIQADATTWKVPAKRYNFVYLDIWANVPNEDNLPEI